MLIPCLVAGEAAAISGGLQVKKLFQFALPISKTKIKINALPPRLFSPVRKRKSHQYSTAPEAIAESECVSSRNTSKSESTDRFVTHLTPGGGDGPLEPPCPIRRRTHPPPRQHRPLHLLLQGDRPLHPPHSRPRPILPLHLRRRPRRPILPLLHRRRGRIAIHPAPTGRRRLRLPPVQVPVQAGSVRAAEGQGTPGPPLGLPGLPLPVRAGLGGE